MNWVIVTVVIAFLGAAVSVDAQKSIKPGSTYHQDGITIVSPKESGWITLKTGKSETAFEKRTETDILGAGVKITQTKPYETDKDRLPGWEALKNEEFSKFKQDHLHFTYMKFKGVMCLHYDGFFPLEPNSSNKFAYFNVRGYVCSRSNAKDSVVQIEFSDYSNTRGFTEGLHSFAERFFEKVTFPKSR